MKWVVAVAAPLAAAAALAAGAPHDVTMSAMQFGPSDVTVRQGDTVTWHNKDIVPHTATSKGKFDSGNIAPGQSFSRRMDQRGVFDYVCNYHPGMKGKVTVK